jgi:hypothetical protein
MISFKFKEDFWLFRQFWDMAFRSLKYTYVGKKNIWGQPVQVWITHAAFFLENLRICGSRTGTPRKFANLRYADFSLQIWGFVICGEAHLRNLRFCYCGMRPSICGFATCDITKKSCLPTFAAWYWLGAPVPWILSWLVVEGPVVLRSDYKFWNRFCIPILFGWRGAQFRFWLLDRYCGPPLNGLTGPLADLIRLDRCFFLFWLAGQVLCSGANGLDRWCSSSCCD